MYGARDFCEAVGPADPPALSGVKVKYTLHPDGGYCRCKGYAGLKSSEVHVTQCQDH